MARARARRSPEVLTAVVVDALAAAQGRVNRARPGIVVLTASIFQPDFDQMVVDAIHAAFQAVGRRHRGVAAVAIVMPKVLPIGTPDQVGLRLRVLSHPQSAFLRRRSGAAGIAARVSARCHRHDADAVERRAVDQLRADDGVDQDVLLRIDGAMDLECLEEQRGGREGDHLGLRQSLRHGDGTDRAAGDREAARVFGKSETTLDAARFGANM